MKKLNKGSSETVIDIPTIEKPQLPKKPKINPLILKVLSVIVLTLIRLLAPEAEIPIFLIRLLLIWLEWLNQK